MFGVFIHCSAVGNGVSIWRDGEEERQRLSPSRCSTTGKGVRLWRDGGGSARKGSDSLPPAVAQNAKASAFGGMAAGARGKAATLSPSRCSAAGKNVSPNGNRSTRKGSVFLRTPDDRTRSSAAAANHLPAPPSPAGGQRRPAATDCRFADTPSASLLKHLRKGEDGAAE